ncbi:MAG TPA: hydroxymyristoyl-ACP dehydratase [Ramlibacter sp.]|nr:hydroxymyristoyl-ACP dehydratase [Ramlibacter sp.]
MKLDRERIEELVPHSGAMCLLDEVTGWTPTAITCSSAAPTVAHPLARAGALSAIAATEYAAQATAVHGALLEQARRPRAGMLAALVDVQLGQAVRVGGAALSIEAELLSRSAAGCLYTFRVSAESAPVASGRLMVALLPEPAP